MKRVKVGVVGCGNISDLYLSNCVKYFDNIEITACSDLDISRAEEKCKKYGIKKAVSLDELLSDPEIEIVLDLTTPKQHAKINMLALKNGKNVYSEKPFAINCAEAKDLMDVAKEKNLLIGCAPDTFLGGGIQTMREKIDEGYIGKPVAVFAHFADHGPEGWHPDPEYYYQIGAGPLYEIGPYFLTALINLVGPVKSVIGSAKISEDERTITSEKKFGKKIKVEIPTHVMGLLEFENGVTGTIISSYDIWHTKLPYLEVYGTEGTLNVGFPAYDFGGPVSYWKKGADTWVDIPLTHGYSDVLRGLGLSDMAKAIRNGGLHRANGALGYHVLEIITGILHSARDGKRFDLQSRCLKPEPMSME